MKKLTAGIFATLLAVVSTGAANAEIASKGYVDQQVDSVEATVANKADSATVTALDTRVKTAEGEIDTLQTTTDQHTSQIGTINTTLSKKLDSDTAASTYQTLANKTTSVSGDSTDTQYPSAKAVWTAVQSVDANASVEALEGRVDSLETASANHVVKNEAITGGTHTKITYDAKGLVTAGANLTADDIPTIPNSKVSGLGSLATKSSVATTDIASKAVTKEKLADDIVTSLGKADNALQQADLNGYLTKTAADAAYAGKTLETQVGTVSKENMGTTTATTVVAGVKEAIDAAKAAASAASAADTKAGQAKTAADTAQGEVDALEGVVNHATTGLAAAHTAIDDVEGRVTTAEGEIEAIQTEMDTMATSETVTNLTNRVTTAEGDIDNLEAAVNDAESGLAATNAIADEALADAATAQEAAEAAQATADKKQDKLTGTIGGSMQPVYLNNGTITAGTTLGDLATKSKVTNTEVDDGALAQSKISGLATSLAAKLTTPPTSAKGEDGLYVLTYNGTDFQWEDIARTVAD